MVIDDAQIPSNDPKAISGFTNTAQASVYRYDQLNRLKTVKTYTDANLTLGNNWSATTTYTDAYHSEYTYDKNGNLATLERKGNDSATLYAMDALIYHTGQLEVVSNSKLNTIGNLVYQVIL